MRSLALLPPRPPLVVSAAAIEFAVNSICEEPHSLLSFGRSRASSVRLKCSGCVWTVGVSKTIGFARALGKLLKKSAGVLIKWPLGESELRSSSCARVSLVMPTSWL